MSEYIVIGPERWRVVPLLDDGTGPSEPDIDVYYVSAPTRRAAKWAAFNRAKEQGTRWWRDLDVEHPLKGVRAEPACGESADDWPASLVVVAGVAPKEPT